MTNEQIIQDIARSIYGEDEVDEMIAIGADIPLHTLKGWLARGYKIRKSEHGIEVKLWKRRTGNTEQNVVLDNESTESGGFYKIKAYLFTAEQVEQIED